MKTCANCERKIGNLEESFNYNNNDVCKECNNILAGQRDKEVVVEKGYVTTQKTSKGHKAAQLIGALMIIFGLAGQCHMTDVTGDTSGSEVSIAIAIIGLLIYLLARVSAWWDHG